MHATAISRDGSVFAVTGGEPATVPAGEYRLGTVTVALDDPKTGQRWSFVFSDGGRRASPGGTRSTRTRRSRSTRSARRAFELKLEGSERSAVRPGEDVAVQPALYTGDGLLIVVAYCGNPVSPAVQEILGARIVLMTADGKTLATAHSGFS